MLYKSEQRSEQCKDMPHCSSNYNQEQGKCILNMIKGIYRLQWHNNIISLPIQCKNTAMSITRIRQPSLTGEVGSEKIVDVHEDEGGDCSHGRPHLRDGTAPEECPLPLLPHLVGDLHPHIRHHSREGHPRQHLRGR